MKNLKLVQLTAGRKADFLEMLREYEAAGERRFAGLLKSVERDITPYLKFLDKNARGISLPPNRVPQTKYWLVQEDKTFLGDSNLRHGLNPALTLEGGHIGYSIRPYQRRMGYGTEILRLTLEKAQALGLQRLLVTCDVDNIPSTRIIRRNGGLLENEAISENSGKPIYRFWIDL